MDLDFKPVCLSMQSEYREFFSRCSEMASDYSFINLWGWADVYGLEWARIDSLIFIRQALPEPAYWAPVGNWAEIDWVGLVKEYPELKTTFIRVPETLAGIWQTVFDDAAAVEDRDQWDYLYDAQALRELRGNRFHKKKNLLNQFVRSYEYQYREMTAGMIDQALALQDDWCIWRECASDDHLVNENRALTRVLSNWDTLLGISGGSLWDRDRMVACTVGERVADDTLVIHFEKGDPAYRGIYQAINQMFLAGQSPSIQWVNREQDLGDDGLRKAKQSYHPAGFLKKYRIALR